jgi:glutathione gamma-glutamylcysteinyltransferase
MHHPHPHHHDRRRRRSSSSSSSSSSRSHSTAAAEAEDGLWDDQHKHCKTCTCEKQRSVTEPHQNTLQQQKQELSKEDDNNDARISAPLPPCGVPSTHYQASSSAPLHQQQQQQQQRNDQIHQDNLPPPLPEPSYSVRRRLLSDCPGLVPLDSSQGRALLLESLVHNTAASYIPLTQHFLNQSEPAFCGVTTLTMVLNTLAIDPMIRWRGGWRYFGSEDVLLHRCCLSSDSIRRVGITMREFAQLAACQGLRVTMKHPIVQTTSNTETASSTTNQYYSLEDFRRDIRSVLVESSLDSSIDTDSGSDNEKGILVASFARSALGQTGDGHFSPIAAYAEEQDACLVLDVARFKYQPYWVSIADLYTAMGPVDSVTQQPRGWYILRPPVEVGTASHYHGTKITTEERRPARLVPALGEKDACPVHEVKVEFCPVRRHDDLLND